MLRQLLQQAYANGSLSALLDELDKPETEMSSDEFDMVPSTPGAMTDGSKRRKEVPPVREMPKDHQLPISPNPTKSAAEYGLTLPPGITNFQQWGKTLLKVGKFASAGLSYEELCDSSDPAHQNYTQYLLTQKHRLDLTGPVKDVVRYINYRYQQHLPDAPSFEDSVVRRQFKK